ncbi:hypothetical protein [Pseudomonas pohangensis]|uniref:hypothetical protein n=1 Tax=Pseudomonas pohangensis TaxID=364197 RepID=UPI0012FDFE41|nr:hypothetical protein [Pseudomonas pohangensis]
MNKRVLALGLFIAVLASAISQALLHGQKAIATDVVLHTPYFLSPIFSMLIQATSMLAWAVPGLYVGYSCKNKPVQHGAIVGAAYAVILGADVFAMQSSKLIDTDSLLVLAVFALTEIAKYSVLFALVAPAGYLLATNRANL